MCLGQGRRTPEPWVGLFPPVMVAGSKVYQQLLQGLRGEIQPAGAGAAREHGRERMGEKPASRAGEEIPGRCRSHGLSHLELRV